MMILPELVVLLDLDIESSTAAEAGVARPAVDVEPQVAGLEVRAILSPGAAEGEHCGHEAVKPPPEEVYAELAAAVHAAAGRVRRGREEEQPAYCLRVDREDQATRDPLEPGQASRQSGEVARAVRGGRQAEAAVPVLDGANGVLEDGERGFEGEAVPETGPEGLVRHGQEVWQDALLDRPG